MAIEILQSIVGMQLANQIEILCVSLRVSLAFMGFIFLGQFLEDQMPEFRWGCVHGMRTSQLNGSIESGTRLSRRPGPHRRGRRATQGCQSAQDRAEPLSAPAAV